jgi:hypothetical protein
MLPDVCRTLIYFKRNDEARTHIAREKVLVRRLLFTGLLAFMENKPADAAKAWHSGSTCNRFVQTALRHIMPRLMLTQKHVANGNGMQWSILPTVGGCR